MSVGRIVPMLLAVLLQAASAGVGAAEPIGPDPETYQKMVAAAVRYLTRQAQSEDGSFSKAAGIGPTALVTTGLLSVGRSPEDPAVAAGLKFLEKFVRDDGGIHQEETRYRNYETCTAMMCFAAANRQGRYDEIVRRAGDFVKGLQWDGEEGHDRDSPAFGGAGYGRHRRPDLSNTSFLIDALRAAGNDPQDEALQKALVFVSRCQNLETEHNTTKWATKNPDGGFYYTAAAGGSSQAGMTPEGGLRSYGAMTYAGLKSMIFAGVQADDPRVKAAYHWARQHYTVAENPGLGDNGLYYYYHTFAKALDAIGEDVIVDAEGKRHDWRRELAHQLARRQNENGSWVNENSRWLEGDPALVTGYALLTLSYCRPQEQKP